MYDGGQAEIVVGDCMEGICMKFLHLRIQLWWKEPFQQWYSPVDPFMMSKRCLAEEKVERTGLRTHAPVSGSLLGEVSFSFPY